MLPAKISNLLLKLRQKTDEGEYKWDYDDEESSVTLETDNNKIAIRYKFNTVEEVGQFNIHYVNKEKNKDYYFSTNELNEDYNVARALFDVAQSSDIEIDEDF